MVTLYLSRGEENFISFLRKRANLSPLTRTYPRRVRGGGGQEASYFTGFPAIFRRLSYIRAAATGGSSNSSDIAAAAQNAGNRAMRSLVCRGNSMRNASAHTGAHARRDRFPFPLLLRSFLRDRTRYPTHLIFFFFALCLSVFSFTFFPQIYRLLLANTRMGKINDESLRWWKYFLLVRV